jgi:hypothetical protein
MHQQWIPHTRRANIRHRLIADIVKTSSCLSLSLSLSKPKLLISQEQDVVLVNYAPFV